MAQTSTKRKNTLIIFVIIIVLVVSSIGAVVVINFSLSTNHKDNVTVSGEASSSGVLTVFPASLQTIEFTDIQTGTKTSFRFPFAPQSSNSVGNYSVTLKNGHTYSVTISYYYGPVLGSMKLASDYITTFTVHAPAGKTSISKDFPGPDS
jgi:heme/copper-type cytochrome/quinol oxidase subunit 2